MTKYMAIKGGPAAEEEPIKNRDIVLMNYTNDRYVKYLNEPLVIGMTERFPEVPDSVVDEQEITDVCRNFTVKFKVRYGKVYVGSDKKYTCMAVTTDCVEIAHRLPMNGFGSHCYADEAACMEKAVVQMMGKHGLMPCDKSCSWPFAKAIVQVVTDDYLRSYLRETKKK